MLCPVNTKLQGELSKHQKTEHGTTMTAETFTTSLTKEIVDDWIQLCFGEAKDVGRATLQVRLSFN